VVTTRQGVSAAPGQWAWRWRTVLVVSVAIGIGAYLRYGSTLTLENLATHETTLRIHQASSPIVFYSAAFAFYVFVAGLSLPFATLLSLSYGWYFGTIQGILLVSFASTAGATIAFLLSRYLVGTFLQKQFETRLEKFNRALDREGAFFLFFLRLVPAIPFFVINVVMGLTTLRTRTFWWVSQLGMLPATVIYVSAGATVPNLQTLVEQGAAGLFTPSLIVAFALLGIFPFAVKKLINTFRKRKQVYPTSTEK